MTSKILHPPPPVALRPDAGNGVLLLEDSRSHINDAPQVRIPLDEWSARRRDLYLTTLTTGVLAPGGIRTHNTWFQYHLGYGRLSEVRPDYFSSTLCSWYDASWLLVIMLGLVIMLRRVQSASVRTGAFGVHRDHCSLCTDCQLVGFQYTNFGTPWRSRFFF